MTKPRPFGHYFILEKIAQGGMAEIFKGLTYDFSGLKKFIVIKRILPHIAVNKDFIKMLIDEAKIAVKLSHGNIAQTFDLGKVADDYFIVMEYVDGRTISQIYKKTVEYKTFIPIPISAYVVSEICNGLDYMHRRKDENGRSLEIVHRDISPQNVILTESGNVKIVDFGVAKAAFKLSEMERGVLKGKFAYMSPEQTEGKNIDFRSDIFSTGVVLWEMLTGRRLFKKKSNPETIDAVQAMTVFPPSAYRNEIPSDLDEIVMRALERDPQRRYAAAADMSLDLTKFLLRHYPEFKPTQVGDFLKEIFDNEEKTGDLYQEKTMREELTVRERVRREGMEEEAPDVAEDTMIVDPQELDFHSIFEEIDVEELSDITRAIGLGETSQTGAAPAVTFSEDSSSQEEEITGDLEEPAALPSPPSPDVGPPPSKPISAPEAPPIARRRELLVVPMVLLLLLAALALYHFLLASAPGGLKLSFQPADAKLTLDGKAVAGSPPIHLPNLPARRRAVLSLEREGFETLELSPYIFPNWTRSLNLSLTKRPPGQIQLLSDPAGADIYFNGKASGKRTPAILDSKDLQFPVLLALSLNGTPQWERRLEAPPREALRIFADLKAALGSLDVQSSPAGALVKIDGKTVGKTPLLTHPVPANETLDLTLDLPGFKPYANEVSVAPGQKLQIYHAMEKNPSR
ncbi:PEGA domain-containing protein [Deltaproteobacteria bacterium PRO3]|nr:PEGA domain-containing protein [Deltaproteobacteria bacterium PRO3]